MKDDEPEQDAPVPDDEENDSAPNQSSEREHQDWSDGPFLLTS
jgi:hypothetical protein